MQIDMQEGVRTACLKQYLIRAWKETVDPNVENHLPASIFALKITEDDKPFLGSDQTNHIITYSGAFNPPHRGHMDIFADGFRNSGPGLNIISGLIIPIPDDGLQAKEAARKASGPAPPQVMLTLKQRADLIMKHLRGTEALREHACKTMVWSFPEYTPIGRYMRRVLELTAAGGFDVEFVSLKGPDHLWYDRPIKHPALIMCNKIVFSEVSRANPDTWVEGCPRSLKGDWTSWSEISNVTGDDGVTRSVWECTLGTPAGSAVRLLTDDNKADKPDISSTRVRKIIMESDPGEDREALIQKLREADVISPETLVDFLGEDAQ